MLPPEFPHHSLIRLFSRWHVFLGGHANKCLVFHWLPLCALQSLKNTGISCQFGKMFVSLRGNLLF